MKKVLFSLAAIALLIPAMSMTASAQNNARPIPVPALSYIIAQHPVPGTLTQHFPKATGITEPSYCNPCLFYGGDFDPNNAMANALADANTLAVPQTYVYSPFVVPAGQRWAVTELGINTLPTGSGTVFDPMTAEYSINSGVHEGSGGHVGASGTGPIHTRPTGRSGFGFTEQTVLVKLNSPARLRAGNFWEAVVPQCTNSNNSFCTSGYYFESDSEEALNAYGPPEPLDMTYFNSAFFGFTFANAETEVCGGFGCDAFSAFVVGTVH